MRILVYCDEDLSVAAGGARQVVELAEALAARGHAVLVVAPQAAGEGRDCYDLGRVHVKCVSVVRRKGLRPLSFFMESFKIVSRTIREWHPDVSVWFDSPGQMAPLWVLRRHRCPYVYFVNGLPHEEVQGLWRRTPIRQLLSYGLRRAVRSAQVVVSICPEVFTSLRHFEPVETGRCAVIRNGVDPDRFFPQPYEKARAELGLPAAGPYIGFVGGFFPWHGLDALIESIPAVAKVYPGVQLLLVGDGQTKEALEHLVHRSHLSAHVRFVGRAECDAVSIWMAAADVCVVLHKQTRSYPGDSMKLWEYLACGRPVVATAGPGYGDTVEAIGCGLAANPDDPDDLARQLLCLLADQELRNKMGECGRAAVLRSHTWAARAKQLEQACRQAIAGVKPTL